MKKLSAALFLVLGLICQVCGFNVTAKVAPQSMLAGEPGFLSITCDAPHDMEFALPEVKGINWLRNRISTSRSYSSINGRTTRSVTRSICFTVDKAGEYEIPAIAVTAGKEKAYTKTLKFTVNAPGNAPGSGSNVPAHAQIVWGRVGKFYTGEWIPLDVVLTVPDGMNVSRYSYPQLSGVENLIFRNFSNRGRRLDFGEVRHERTVYKNVNATRVIFPAQVKAITARIPDVTGSITIGILRRDEPRQEERFDSFFDSFFERSSERIVPITLTIEKAEKTPVIEPLPNIPEGVNYLDIFGKAVISGKFTQQKCTAGESVELVVDVISDDISQLKAPELKVDGFRVYKPEVRFIGGKAEIRYCFIPVKPGKKDVLVKFASFDNRNGKYLVSEVGSTLEILPSLQTVTPNQTTVKVAEQTENQQVNEPVKKPSQRTEPLYIKTKTKDDGVYLELWKNSIIFYFTGFVFLPALAVLMVFWKRRKMLSDPEKQYKNSVIKYACAIIRNKAKNELTAEEKQVIVRAAACSCGMSQSATASEIAEKTDDPELKAWFTKMDEASFNSMATEDAVLTNEIRNKLLKVIKCCTVLIVFAVSSVYGNDAAKLFDEAKYAEAAQLYRKQLDKNKPSPQLLYNIGTCYLKANELGKARAALFAAHRLSPRDEEITENLNLVNRKLRHEEVNLTDTPLRLYKYCRDRMRPDEHLAMASIIFGLAMLLLAFDPRRWKMIVGTAGAILMLISYLMFDQQYDSYASGQAVILPEYVELRDLPSSASGSTTATISGGSDAKILQTRGDWVEIETNGKTGWIKTTAIALITH